MYEHISPPATVVKLVSKVVYALRREASAHPSEHWDDVRARLTEELCVGIELVRDCMSWEYIRRSSPTHGNLSIRGAINDYYVVVTDGPRWRFAFKVLDWNPTTDLLAAAAKPVARERIGPRPSKSAETSTAKTSEPSQRTGDSGSLPESKEMETGRNQPAPGHVKGIPTPPTFNEPALIREFDKRERERGPIFVGFIVNDLLVRRGIDPPEGKRIVRAMEVRDVIRTQQKQNPKNPERMTTFVVLNRDHPSVQQALGLDSEPQEVFPIGTVSGELLSERILRERG